MGYRAPSAEDVYRYALRLDSSQRTLTDRFSLSIVLVNDTSPLCREFLENYCVDLCFRTADRIRFIFFSELPEQEFEGIAVEMNRGTARNGMLRSILDSIHRWRRHEPNFNYEYEPWQRLRPDGLQPLSKLDDIQKQLNWECDLNTAMPGAGMAMQFAQRLGIGRHVPCVVVFTDIGELFVDVMPIGHMRPHEIYSHIRGWVDSYYEVNREKIDRWSRIEKEIEELCSKAGNSLWEIRRWRETAQKTWEDLVSVAELIRLIESDKGTSETLASRLSHLPEVANIYQEFLVAVRPLEKRARMAQTLYQEQQRLSELRGADQAFQALRLLEEKVLPSLGLGAPPSLRIALTELWEGIQHARVPKDELEGWWNKAANARLSPRRFEKFRRNWAHLIPSLMQTTAEVEYALAVGTLRAVPLRTELAGGAAMVLDTLAAHYHVDGTSDEWHRATVAYRDYLIRYLAIICETAPTWLLVQLPDLQVEDVGDPANRTTVSFADFMNARPEVAHALEMADPLRRQELLEIRLRNDQLASQYLATVHRDLLDMTKNLAVSESDWTAAREKALLQLRQWRMKLETVIGSTLTTAKRKDPPTRSLDTPLWAQVMSALDNYDRVVESIEYPHRRDPLVRQMSLRASVTVALDLEQSRMPTGATQRLRKRLNEAVKSERQSADLWEQLRSEVVGLTPQGQLARVLAETLTEERLYEVLCKYHGQTVQERVEQAIGERRGLLLMERLSDSELAGILGALGKEKQAQVDVQSISRQQKIEYALSKIGLYNGHMSLHAEGIAENALVARTLQTKMDKGEYDVFLAHNAKDKSIVLQIGGLLMRRGIYPWIDVQQVPPGSWWQDVTQAVMIKVKSAAIFLGTHSIGRWQAVEIRAFISQCLDRDIPVIPVLLPGVNEIPQDMGFLRELAWVQFPDIASIEGEALDRLIWGITGKRQSPLSDVV